MYQDHRPCQVCGSEVKIRPHSELTRNEPDSTIDERVCTNPDCPTQAGDESA